MKPFIAGPGASLDAMTLSTRVLLKQLACQFKTLFSGTEATLRSAEALQL